MPKITICTLRSSPYFTATPWQQLSPRIVALRRRAGGRMRYVIQYSPLCYQAIRRCWSGLSREAACHLLVHHGALPRRSTMPHQETPRTPPGREKETTSRQTTTRLKSRGSYDSGISATKIPQIWLHEMRLRVEHFRFSFLFNVRNCSLVQN